MSRIRSVIEKSFAAKALREWKVIFECDVFETGSDQRGNKSSVFLVLIPPRFPWVWNLSQYLDGWCGRNLNNKTEPKNPWH